MKKILTNNPPPAIKHLYEHRARLFGVGGRMKKGQKNPHDVATHLKSINAVLKVYYNASIVSADSRSKPYYIRNKEWCDDVFAPWKPGAKAVPVDAQADVYEA